MTIGDVKDNLANTLHGIDIDQIDSIDLLLERSANTLLSKINPIETIRTVALSQVVHDDVYNYALPSDFKEAIDLYPQDDRNFRDSALRVFARPFDLQKAIKNKQISIEGSEGSKILRINWRSRQGKVLHTMNSVTDNGTWSAVGSATGVTADTIFKVSGSGSIKFTHVASGDGIQNTTINAIDLTDENGVSDVFVWVFFSTVPTSVTAIWGNDLTTNYWTGVAQTTQADGTAFKTGWNLLKYSWSAATQTGTVTPSTIDSFKITVAGTALGTMRVDNIIFSIGRNFDIKYYSKYIIKNTSGTWLSRTTSDADTVVLDNDAMQIFHLENLIAAAQQVEDSEFDIAWAKKELGNPNSANASERVGLYSAYLAKYPSQSKKAVGFYGSLPRFRK